MKNMSLSKGLRSDRVKLFALVFPSLLFSIGLNAEILFEDNFDDQPDYVASEDLNLNGWSFRRNGEVEWSESKGFEGKHDAFEVVSTNRDKARGGVGKSFVAWRESYNPGWNQFNSDGILLKQLSTGQDQLYVSFYVMFSPNWTPAGQTKLFRVYSWDEASDSPFKFFSNGNAGPIFIWDYSYSDSYGVRNFHAYRGGPHGENYSFEGGDILGLPRNMVNLGDVSMSYTRDTIGMALNGGTPKIKDKRNGGFLSDNLSQPVRHEQLFGRAEWTKVAFFLKMNSEVGKTDGALIQWIDDEVVFRNDKISWVGENVGNRMVKWNMVGIGGNDFFRAYPNENKHEEWYAIDDVFVSTVIPPDVNFNNPPVAPEGIKVE
ncbi:hypothetical protein [Marinobacter sp.]|uniref:hypothetical protein n=1 Tax=Marinobacter sp. TaxID=50741 RepID=UPI003A8D1000